LPERLADLNRPLTENLSLPAQHIDYVRDYDAHVRAIAARHGVAFISPHETLCDGWSCLAAVR